MNRSPRRKRNRRDFIRSFSTATVAAGLVAEQIWSRPYSPLPNELQPTGAIRIRGLVTAQGSPLSRVAVSDGLTVRQSREDGSFELISTVSQPFVFISVPAGFRIPVSESGTARFHQPIRPDARGEMEVRFELKPLPQSDEEHVFFLLADPQTEDAYEVGLFHQQTVPDVRAVAKSFWDRAAFGIGCGDLMFDNLFLFPEYQRAVSGMEIPFFQVVGNHDLDQEAASNEESTRTFRRYFGPEYYSFNRGAVHYVVLNDVFWYGAGYLGYLSGRQLDWLKADLDTVEAGSPVIVALHIPVQSTLQRRRGEEDELGITVQNREELYRLLEPFQAHVLSAHTHESEHVFAGGVAEHVHGAVCGAWWSGPVCYDGTPCGYGIYEVRGEEIRWHYKCTGQELSRQMRVYPRGREERAPDEIVANVWNWDPGWKVFWYENGSRKGILSRRHGLDPLSRQLHLGPELPVRRPWVEPQPTGHLFYAPASPQATGIVVEAVDRFGREYSATVGEDA